jgi:hypothetical protein
MKNVKLFIVAFLANVLILVNSVNASFPTKSATPKEVKTEQVEAANAELAAAQVIAKEEKAGVAAKSLFSAKSLDEIWILLLLWFFLGGLAAHRWYAGKPVGANILFILTLGGCGIWALIDLINILTGKF